MFLLQESARKLLKFRISCDIIIKKHLTLWVIKYCGKEYTAMMKLLKTPNTFTFDGEAFISHAENIAKNEKLIANLRARADKLMQKPLPTVTDRKIKAISGNIHDYCSMGPYWWPNPDTENGLPYIRRDGEKNPETEGGSTFWSLFHDVFALTLASYYTDEPKYAERAVQFMENWYITPETLCNPHLEYGQSIPGVCNGRGIGLIDTCQSYELFDSVALLDAMGFMPEKTLSGLKAWYNEFLNWMLTSEIGIDEDRAHNNHGTWYDVQVAVTALFLGRTILAERTLSLAYERRILKHVDAEGKQPYELTRTKAMHYSLYNLQAMILIAKLSNKAHCKKDPWQEKREDGSIAIRAAIDYITQFASGLDNFPYKDISGKPDTDSSARVMLAAAPHYPDDNYTERAARYLTDTQVWRLIP